MSRTRRIFALPAPHLLATGFATLVLLLGPVGCGGDGDNTSTESATTPTTETTTGQNVNDHGTKTFADESGGEVELDDNYFSPTTIQGKAGQTLRLELKNEGNAPHNLTLTAQNVDVDVQAAEDTKVSVRVPQSGKADFFCKFHKAQGMAGSLAVASGSGGDSSGSGGSGSGSGGGSSGGTTTGSDDSSGGYGN